MKYARMYSMALLCALLAGGVALALLAPGSSIVVFGNVAAALADFKFLVLLAFGLLLLTWTNPIILAALSGVIRSVYMQLTLQSYWHALGIPPLSPFHTFWPGFVGALAIYSVGHLVAAKPATNG